MDIYIVQVQFKWATKLLSEHLNRFFVFHYKVLKSHIHILHRELIISFLTFSTKTRGRSGWSQSWRAHWQWRVTSCIQYKHKMSLFPFKALNSHHFNHTFEVLIQERKGGSDSASSSAWMPFGEPQDDVLICFGFVAAKPCKNYNNNHLQVPLWRTSGKPILQAHYISLIFFLTWAALLL